ncbi:MAG TPA: glycosyltransferase [Clostridiales bacterium]|nr:glycosyltransferase [Clostridiales bacterium]
MMQISVVMTTYNGEAFINQQLDSIIKQTLLPDEILVCDDYSNDSTWGILESYQIKYPELIHICKNEKNIGFEHNFLNLLKKAEGDIIFLSDQDDVWYSNKIKSMYQMFERNPNILALSTAYDLIDEYNSTYRDIRSVVFNNNKRLKKISWKDFVIHPKYPGMAMAVRKSLLNQVSWIELSKVPAHDWLLNLFASIHDGMYLWDNILTSYRQHKSNVIGSSANKHISDARAMRISTTVSLLKTYELFLEICEKQKYDNNKIELGERLTRICKKRMELIESERLWALIRWDISNYNYLTLRTFLGDVYMGLKIKLEKG